MWLRLYSLPDWAVFDQNSISFNSFLILFSLHLFRITNVPTGVWESRHIVCAQSGIQGQCLSSTVCAAFDHLCVFITQLHCSWRTSTWEWQKMWISPAQRRFTLSPASTSVFTLFFHQIFCYSEYWWTLTCIYVQVKYIANRLRYVSAYFYSLLVFNPAHKQLFMYV